MCCFTRQVSLCLLQITGTLQIIEFHNTLIPGWAKTTANLHVLFKLTVRTLKPGHLKEDAQSQRVLKTRFSSFITYGPSINIHQFEDCFMRGQASSNGLKVFNDCIVEYLNFTEKIVSPQKKNLRIFYF